MWMGGEHHAPAALPPRKILYLLYRKLGGPQDRSGRVRKLSSSPRFDVRIVHPVASLYKVYAVGDVHLNMQTRGYFEMSAPIYEALSRYIPQDRVNVNVIVLKEMCSYT
jgi:hypothetical protein